MRSQPYTRGRTVSTLRPWQAGSLACADGQEAAARSCAQQHNDSSTDECTHRWVVAPARRAHKRATHDARRRQQQAADPRVRSVHGWSSNMACGRSRHVDRRYFKVRELAFEGVLRVEHIDTKLNPADLLTKSLKKEAHVAHRARALNLP